MVPPRRAGVRQVTTDGGTNPSWSPDGHHIVYVGPDALYTINVDDPADTPHKVAGTDDRSFTPAWSPDGALIAYEHIPSSGPWEIDVIAPDGSGEHAIVTAPSDSLQEVQPAWSADGSRL